MKIIIDFFHSLYSFSITFGYLAIFSKIMAKICKRIQFLSHCKYIASPLQIKSVQINKNRFL